MHLEKKMEYQQISTYNKIEIYPLLLQASSALKIKNILPQAKELVQEL
jgi:hypothetical protein